MGKIFLLVVALLCISSSAAYAPLVTVYDEDSGTTTTSDDTSVVDLSDVDTDAPTWSPSFENTTPAGMAPGEPITSDDEAEE